MWCVEHEASHAGQRAGRCAAHGVVQAPFRNGADLSSGSGRSYCSHEFQNALAGHEMKSLMSRKSDYWERARREPVWGG